VALNRSSAPSTEPITTDEAKTHLRQASSDDDTFIGELITAAREHIESLANRSLITQTWVLKLDAFPGAVNAIYPPRPPLQSVTSIAYTDSAGDAQTLAASLYAVSTDGWMPRIVPVYGETWPVTEGNINDVTVTYVAGYGATAADVPEALKSAIKLQVELLYDRPIDKAYTAIVDTIESLIGPYRAVERVQT